VAVQTVELEEVVSSVTRGMHLPRLVLLTCCIYCIVHRCSCFEFPRFDDIAETFSNLARKVRSASTDTSEEQIASEEDEVKSRSKRQTSHIGDESPYPYEIRSSRLETEFCLMHTCIPYIEHVCLQFAQNS